MDLYRKEAGLLGSVYLETIEKEQEKHCHLNHKFISIVKLRGGGTCGNEGAQFIFIPGST
jgi:hypothetical protein